MKTQERPAFHGYIAILIFIGFGVLLALWWQEGFPGFRFLANLAAALGLVVLLANLFTRRTHPAWHAAAILLLAAFAIYGAFHALDALARFFAGLL